MPVASRLIQIPVELAQSRDRRDDRLRAVREHDVLRAVAHAVDLDHARPSEPAAAAQQLDALPRQPALLRGVRVSETMKSRQASAASTSTSPLAAASRASCTASPGRNSALDGMQAQ